jgi:hypothetical protein
MNDAGTSYVLWFGCFFGFAGLHRFYNRKPITGLLWLMTWGFFGVGQFVDLVLIPNMVDDHNIKARARLGLSPNGMPLMNQVEMLDRREAIAAPVPVPTRDQLMVKLVKSAAARGGQISVTQAVMDTGVGFAEVESLLKEMLRSGYVRVDNHPVSGVVVYEFVEL